MKEICCRIQKVFKYQYLKRVLLSIGYIYIALFGIAFVMKDHANHEWIKTICREYVYGPKNMIALVVNKIVPGMIEVDSVLIPPPPPVPELPPHEKAVKDVLERYKNQAVIDEQLRTEYESGGYTLDDPFVVVNPYGISPLTALVMFDTEDDMLATVKVVGKERGEDISFNFAQQGYCKKHIIPVYGLYADYDNTVVFLMSTRGGQEYEKEIRITTENLSDYMQQINLVTYASGTDNYQTGLNFSHSSIDGVGVKYAFDINGNIRWYCNEAAIFGGTDYNDGKNIYRSIGACGFGDAVILQESYLGRIEKIFYVSGGIHHDVHVTDNGTLLVTSNHAESLEDLGVEIDINSGTNTNSIDYRKLLPRGRRVGCFHLEPEDWVHINAIVDYDGDYISSSNFQSAVFRHSKSGTIKWILSDPFGYTTVWRRKLLMPVGDNFQYPYNQHAVEVMPDYDNNPDTVDILLFDNGTSRNHVNRYTGDNCEANHEIEWPLYSRLVHYRINEREMTVEQIWSYGENRPELFSETRGDSDLLPNGNILGTFPHENGLAIKNRFPYYDTVYVEVNRAGDIVWECYATSNSKSNKYLDYRLCRTNIYNSSVDYSHLLDESHNYVPDEIMKKYGY